MGKRRPTETELIEQFFGTADREKAFKVYEKVQFILRVRMFIEPERPRRRSSAKEKAPEES